MNKKGTVRNNINILIVLVVYLLSYVTVLFRNFVWLYLTGNSTSGLYKADVYIYLI